MDFLTIGEVIDNIQVGMYAIKISTDEISDEYDFKPIDSPIYIDKNDLILKSMRNEKPVMIGYVKENDYEEKYILISEEEYKALKDTIVEGER